MSTVKEWYSQKNIFITGATGFVGICLLEKILRCIPDHGTIYLLVRPKRGKKVRERLAEIKNNLIFEKLLATSNKDKDEVFAKVECVAGDVGEDGMGLSPSDRSTLRDNVHVIFHSAATLDFAETLKSTVDVNLLGTRRVLQLGKECSHLAAFVHVSSAYVNAWKLDPVEIVYPLEKDPEEVIKMAETMSTEELEEQTPTILGKHLNPYTFTKHMAEHEVVACEKDFPCTIVRPSMIVGAWKEPIPGWTMSKNGPQGFLMGAAKGVIRRLPVGKDLVYDYIPVDVVVNTLIVAGLYAGERQTTKARVYHCTTSCRNPFRWSSVEDKVNVYLHRYPLKSAVWYPHLKFLPSVARFAFSAKFVHILPALILDFFTKLFGGRPILMKLHRNVNSSLNRLSKFIFTEWMFSSEKTMGLQTWLNHADAIEFTVDAGPLSWVDYFDDLTQGARRYLNKEHMGNIDAARGKDKLLMVLHLALQCVIYYLIWSTFAWITGASMTKSAFIVPLAVILFSYV